jgi:pyrroline-5-carboxylate reductase
MYTARLFFSQLRAVQMGEISAAFIGAGNMAGSIIDGLLDKGFPPAGLRASSPGQASLDRLRARGIEQVSTDNRETAAAADVVVLCVKPGRMREVCEEIAPVLSENQLVLSVAAGVSCASIDRWLAGRAAVLRCVPNTPARIGAGVTAVFSAASLEAERRGIIDTILGAVGPVCWVDDEEAMNWVTALSGSGPAYFFLLMEAMIDEAVRMGLDRETARTLCARTCAGAGLMLSQEGSDATTLRRKVTSPGGTTEQAIGVFEDSDLRGIVSRAMQAALRRSRELAVENS